MGKVKSFFEKAVDASLKLPFLKVLLVYFCITWAILMFFNFLFLFLDTGIGRNTTVDLYYRKPRILKFFTLVIIAPVLETFFYQLLPNLICRKIFSGYNFYLITTISSAVLFGASHYYTIPYSIIGLVAGLIFIFSFLTRLTMKDALRAICSLYFFAKPRGIYRRSYMRCSYPRTSSSYTIFLHTGVCINC